MESKKIGRPKKDGGPMVQKSIRLPHDQWALINKLAFETQRSQSWIISAIIESMTKSGAIDITFGPLVELKKGES